MGNPKKEGFVGSRYGLDPKPLNPKPSTRHPNP